MSQFMWQFKTLCAALVLALTWCCVRAPAGAVAQTDPESFCGIMVTAEAVADQPNALAFRLWAPGTSSGTVSGTLVVYTGGQRYDVPFAHAHVAPESATLGAPAAVVVRFPHAVALESAYLGALTSQNLPFCTIYSPFIGPAAGGRALLVIRHDAAGGASGTANASAPIDAPLPRPALPLTCKTPYSAPHVGYEATATGPLVLLAGAQVTVHAQLDANGKVIAYTVTGAPAGSSLTARAVAATVGSKFFPETYRCATVAGSTISR